MEMRYIKGVGEKRAAQLAKLGIETAQDMLQFYPRDYVDYSKPYPVAGAPYDEKCVVRATVYGKSTQRISGGREVYKATCGDDTAGLIVTFFNNPYATQKLETEHAYCFYGKIGGGFAAR
ncbi:MAG: ATP-dependent DNA helicase RecG, partial [Ruthenibacterium sp.]